MNPLWSHCTSWSSQKIQCNHMFNYEFYEDVNTFYMSESYNYDKYDMD